MEIDTMKTFYRNITEINQLLTDKLNKLSTAQIHAGCGSHKPRLYSSDSQLTRSASVTGQSYPFFQISRF